MFPQQRIVYEIPLVLEEEFIPHHNWTIVRSDRTMYVVAEGQPMPYSSAMSASAVEKVVPLFMKL